MASSRVLSPSSEARVRPPTDLKDRPNQDQISHREAWDFSKFESLDSICYAQFVGFVTMDELMQQEALSRMMASLPLHMAAEMVGTSGGGGVGIGGVQKEGMVTISGVTERVPQWSQQETREFISIRAELERDFNVSKRNKNLWELVSSRMRERGYRRSPDQCKCKWKNLINRYKGKETSDPDDGRHCPFFDELHAVFTERARNMQRLLLESESGTLHPKKKTKRRSADKSSDEFTDDDDEDCDDSDDDHLNRNKKKKSDRDKQAQRLAADKSSKTAGSVLDVLQEFFQQQQRMETQWKEMVERRAHERRLFEQEWRQSMEKLERERLMMEQSWREREEQRRIREETRAEKRDALLTTLLNKLINEDL